MRSSSKSRARFALAISLALIASYAVAFIPQLEAAPIRGKYGLGVSTGDLLGSRAEGSLLYGHSERTAWLLLVSASGQSDDGSQLDFYQYPDTILVSDRTDSGYSFSLGPGIRRFVRESEHVSPYLEASLQALHSHNTSNSSGPYLSDLSSTTWGTQFDFAIGAEYFFQRWPISIAAHTRLVSVRYLHRHDEANGTSARREATTDSFSSSGGFGPRLQVRAYF